MIAAVRSTGAGVVPGLAVSDTIKQADAAGRVQRDPRPLAPRRGADPAGLPARAARRRVRRRDGRYTDDAAVFAAAGHPVAVIEGDPLAFKITTPWDLRRAEELVDDASQRAHRRRHRRARVRRRRPLWLGGLYWRRPAGALAGISVRRVEDITEALWGTRVSPSTVSNLNKKIYVKIEAWRNRRIEGEHPYLYLDGIVMKRTWAGEVRNVSLLVASAVNSEGYREISWDLRRR